MMIPHARSVRLRRRSFVPRLGRHACPGLVLVPVGNDGAVRETRHVDPQAQRLVEAPHMVEAHHQ